VIALGVGSTAFAEAPSYFYSVAQVADPAWAYPVPECTPISASELKTMKDAKQCVAHAKSALKCTPGKKVELENVNTNEKAPFPVSHFVFKTLKACQRDRKAYFDSLGE
jgi:hypothetical protein